MIIKLVYCYIFLPDSLILHIQGEVKSIIPIKFVMDRDLKKLSQGTFLGIKIKLLI